MERNQIIGFGLIFGLLVVWTFVNSPSKEEMAEMKQRQDSLNRVEILKDSLAGVQLEAQRDTANFDSITLANKFGSFASAASGENQTAKLENEFFIVHFDSKGGKISGVELKKYKKALF